MKTTEDRLKRIKAALVEIVHFADRAEYILRCPECGLQAMDASIFEAEKLLVGHDCRPEKELLRAFDWALDRATINREDLK